MKTGNKETLIVGGCGLALLVLLLFRQQPAAASGIGAPAIAMPGQPNPWGSGNPYSWTNPGFPDPATAPGPTPITVNVGGTTFQGSNFGGFNFGTPVFASLAPYMPLFGFIGTDTSQFYQ